MTLLYRYAGQRLRTGDGVLLYFIAYPLGRLWVEAFRPDAWVMGTLATAQWIAIGSITICTVLLIIRHWKWSWRKHQDESLVSLSVHSTTIPYSVAHAEAKA